MKILTDDGVFHIVRSNEDVLESLETLFNTTFDPDVDVEAKVVDVQIINEDINNHLY